jgi:heterodisulfide reductase subunit A
MANIREQDSWVHRTVPQQATDKAKQLAAMATSKARRLRPLHRNSFDVDHRALVIGGGLAGMTSALAIARQGYEVYLVERKSELGGNLTHIYTRIPGGNNPQDLLKATVEEVLAEERIQVITETEVVGLSGYTGQYCSTLRRADGSRLELHHGAIVVATGAQAQKPREYLYGQHSRVITQHELEDLLAGPASRARQDIGLSQTIVMIQCVGSRDTEHPYCSRVCCTQAIKNALAIKEEHPDARVVVLYRDIRTYGFREQLYRQARQAGVLFLEYSEMDKPVVTAEGEKLRVDVAIQPENEKFSLETDWLVLSAGIEPEPGNADLAQVLKVPLNEAGFFLEAHVKLRPVDFAAEGIFLAGLAHSPRQIEETIAQAQAAAVRAVGLLSRQRLDATPIIASVNPKLCAACGLCVEVCPYGARVLEPGMAHAEVIEVLCQGCGACIVACPNKASQQKGFEFVQMLSMLDAAYS